MSFLTVNGIVLSVEDESLSLETREVGERGYSWDGTPWASIRDRRLSWEFDTSPLPQDTAEAWTALLTGWGYTWDFEDDTYSDQGLAATIVGGAAVSTEQKKYGAKSLKLPQHVGGSDSSAAWTVGTASRWTIVVWYYRNTIWTHLVIRSDGAKWVDSVRNDGASTAWIGISAGVLTVTADDSFNTYVDDLLYLPALVPTDWPAQMYARATAIPSMPYIGVDGDMVRGTAELTVLGQVSGAKVGQGNIGGAWTSAGEKLSVKLEG